MSGPDQDEVMSIEVEVGLLILATAVNVSLTACTMALAVAFVATGSTTLLAVALFAGHMAAKGLD